MEKINKQNSRIEKKQDLRSDLMLIETDLNRKITKEKLEKFDEDLKLKKFNEIYKKFLDYKKGVAGAIALTKTEKEFVVKNIDVKLDLSDPFSFGKEQLDVLQNLLEFDNGDQEVRDTIAKVYAYKLYVPKIGKGDKFTLDDYKDDMGDLGYSDQQIEKILKPFLVESFKLYEKNLEKLRQESLLLREDGKQISDQKKKRYRIISDSIQQLYPSFYSYGMIDELYVLLPKIYGMDDHNLGRDISFMLKYNLDVYKMRYVRYTHFIKTNSKLYKKMSDSDHIFFNDLSYFMIDQSKGELNNDTKVLVYCNSAGPNGRNGGVYAAHEENMVFTYKQLVDNPNLLIDFMGKIRANRIYKGRSADNENLTY